MKTQTPRFPGKGAEDAGGDVSSRQSRRTAVPDGARAGPRTASFSVLPGTLCLPFLGCWGQGREMEEEERGGKSPRVLKSRVFSGVLGVSQFPPGFCCSHVSLSGTPPGCALSVAWEPRRADGRGYRLVGTDTSVLQRSPDL